ncbi:MAG: sugar porter family MFS transporter [Planctomycetota bacterium]
MRTKPYLIGCALIVALGGFLFGFDTVVISGAEQKLEELYGLGGWHGLLMSTALIGTVIGAMVAGRPADVLGRRASLLVVGILYFVSAIGSALAWGPWSFGIFRFIGGLGVGAATVVAPMYTAEISPARYRGRLVALFQFNIVFGIFIAFVSNWLIFSQLDLGEGSWRWMFGVEAVPALVFFCLLLLTPRSPRWLVSEGHVEEARAVLKSMTTATPAAVEAEIAEIRGAIDLEHHSMREPFFRRAYLTPILLVIAIAAFNQLSGINAVLYYAKRIFEMTGVGKDAAYASSCAVGLTNLIFTMFALLVIDHFGRKRLMLVGSIGYIISLGAIAWAFFAFRSLEKGPEGTMQTVLAAPGGTVVLISLLVFIASHAFGQGAVIWVFISEVFPNRLRARGQALGSFTHWFMAALISSTFPHLAETLGGYTFAFYALCMVGQLAWVFLVMPETKGVPLEDIQKKMGIE